jgi:hypothetical protein
VNGEDEEEVKVEYLVRYPVFRRSRGRTDKFNEMYSIRLSVMMLCMAGHYLDFQQHWGRTDKFNEMY